MNETTKIFVICNYSSSNSLQITLLEKGVMVYETPFRRTIKIPKAMMADGILRFDLNLITYQFTKQCLWQLNSTNKSHPFRYY